MPSQGCRRLAARGPRLLRWLRQPRHGGGACWRRNTLGSAPRPKKSWVALLVQDARRAVLLVGYRGPERVRDVDAELAPDPGRTLDRDVAAEELDAALHEREPHPEAVEAARGRAVGLREELEHLGDAVRGDADPRVVHGEDDRARLVTRPDGHADFARGGELEGVAQEVEQEPADERPVDVQDRRIARDDDAQRNAR